MHTSPDDTDEALQILRKYWDGPIGTYPESGYFRMPDWQSVWLVGWRSANTRGQVGRSRDTEDLDREGEWRVAVARGGCAWSSSVAPVSETRVLMG